MKGLHWSLWLPKAWYNKGCIHRLANPRIGRGVGGAIAHCGRSLIPTIALLLLLSLLLGHIACIA